MTAPVFIDTGYILALLNKRDKYHRAAMLAPRTLAYMTTEAVLTEIGNALSRPPWRALAVDTLHDLRHDPAIEIVTVDAGVFDRALALYAARSDKSWGLTDCISFVVMQEYALTHVVTTDQHFVQAGFQNMLQLV